MIEQNGLNLRVKHLIDTQKLSINAFSKQIGVTQTTLSAQIRGEKNVTMLTINAIADAFPTLSMEWLIRGNGLMWHNRDMSSTTATQIGGSHNTINTGSQVSSPTIPSSAPDPRDEKIAMLQQQIDFMMNLMKMNANK